MEKYGLILWKICQSKLKGKVHKAFVEEFIKKLPECMPYYGNNRIRIVLKLLSEELNEYYHTKDLLEESTVTKMFQEMDLDDYDIMIDTMKEVDDWWLLQNFEEVVIEGLQQAVNCYIENVQPDNYYDYYDVDEILERNFDFEYDFGAAADELVEIIGEEVNAEIEAVISKFPNQIQQKIEWSEWDIEIDEFEVEHFLEQYSMQGRDDYDYDEYREQHRPFVPRKNALDDMFMPR